MKTQKRPKSEIPFISYGGDKREEWVKCDDSSRSILWETMILTCNNSIRDLYYFNLMQLVKLKLK